MNLMFAMLPKPYPGFGPVSLLPFTMYIQPPSALKATSVGSYAVGRRPMVLKACGPLSGITARELEPAFTAYSVFLARLIATAVGAAPVVLSGKFRWLGPRVSILWMILLVFVSMTATWS